MVEGNGGGGVEGNGDRGWWKEVVERKVRGNGESGW